MDFDMSYSPDSSVVYIAECEDEEMSYGIVCVALADPTTDLLEAEEILVGYMEFLKDAFEITASVGYGHGHTLQEREDTRGIIDYWNDAEENNWKVKGWTDGQFISVLFVYTQEEIAEEKGNLFLDGFRFPGMD
jgi:hypothetical protein